MNFENKVIVVTGAGNGVGREITLGLVAKGAFVAAVDINQVGLEETQGMSTDPSKISTHVVNIADKEAVSNFVKELKERYEHVDGLINNAGIIQPFINLDELELDIIERIMNVNFYGMVYMTKGLLPLLKESNEACIVNISSMGGVLPVPGQGAYGASKAAVKLFTEALYAEMKGSNITVGLVIPGGISTNIMGNSGMEIKESDVNTSAEKILLTPKSAANKIIATMDKKKFRQIIGKDANVLIGIYTLFPKLGISIMRKFLSLNK